MPPAYWPSHFSSPALLSNANPRALRSAEPLFVPAASLSPWHTSPLPRYLRRIDSPIGRLELTSNGKAITSLTIERNGQLPLEGLAENTNTVIERTVKQLAQYFEGKRRSFRVPTAPGGTEFQRQVWKGLGEIPWGEAITYGELGALTGRATAGRAVGGAVGANPLPILVPCHRVLASNGKITGYSGGNGVPTKVWLLEHEDIPHR